MGETYYEVLEVDPDATREEIEAAYRDRVLETHPDHNDAPDAAEQFKRVSAAKSVLTDGDERARYDRLGHDAYVHLGEQTAGSSGSTADDSSAKAASQSRTETGSTTGRGTTTGDGTTGTSSTASAGTAGYSTTSTGARRTDDRGSHHARQRRRRQRRRAEQRSAGSWPFEGDEGPEPSAGSTTGTDGTGTAAADRSDSDSSSEFRYAVHDWEGEVDLEWDGRSLDQSTALTIGCIWLLYPVFIATSLTSVFPLAVNATVAACTLALVGYLLTKPRIASLVFGSWSLLLPLGIVWTGITVPFSIAGLVALGAVWVPFAYALGLWWALRP